MLGVWGRSGPRRRAQATRLQNKALCRRLRPSPGDTSALSSLKIITRTIRKVCVVIPQQHRHQKSEVADAALCRDLFTLVQRVRPERVRAAVCPGARGGRCPWRGGGVGSLAVRRHGRGITEARGPGAQEAGARSLNPEDGSGQGPGPTASGLPVQHDFRPNPGRQERAQHLGGRSE